MDALAALPEPRRVAEILVGGGDRLAAQTARHGLAPYLGYVLGAAGVQVPADLAETFRQATTTSALLTARARTTTRLAVRALSVRRVPVVILKGLPLAERLYPRPELRPTGDVDLLVAPSDVPAALAALEDAGARVEEARRSLAHQLRHDHALSAITGLGPAMIEVHHRAYHGSGVALEAEPLLARSVPSAFEGTDVRGLGAEDEALYLAVHGSGHLFLRLAWLLDLILLTRRSSIDWDLVRGRAKAAGVAGFVGLASALLERAGVASAAPGSLGYRALARSLEPAIERSWLHGHPYLHALAVAALCRSPGAAIRYLGYRVSRFTAHRVSRAAPRLVPSAWRDESRSVAPADRRMPGLERGA